MSKGAIAVVVAVIAVLLLLPMILTLLLMSPFGLFIAADGDAALPSVTDVFVQLEEDWKNRCIQWLGEDYRTDGQIEMPSSFPRREILCLYIAYAMEDAYIYLDYLEGRPVNEEMLQTPADMMRMTEENQGYLEAVFLAAVHFTSRTDEYGTVILWPWFVPLDAVYEELDFDSGQVGLVNLLLSMEDSDWALIGF